MKNKIGAKLLRSFLLINLIAILIVDVTVLLGVRNYYLSSISNLLTFRMNNTMDLYSKFYHDKNLNFFITGDNNLLWNSKNQQVLIIDPTGQVLMDSLGYFTGKTYNIPKFENKVSKTIIEKTKAPYKSSSIMSVYGRLENDNSTIGYIKFSSSLDIVHEAIESIFLNLFILSVVVLIISAILSSFLARSISKPLNQLTDIAKKYANGEYNTTTRINSYSEINQLSSTMNKMASEILKKEQIKNDFISSVSHELRTPLTSIKGWAVILKDDMDDKKLLSDGLDIIEKESDRLSKMVDSLLDFSRFISGRIQLEKTDFDITRVLKDVLKQLSPRINNNNLTLIDETLNETFVIVADENRIRQVLINILDNAIKFTSENGWIKVKSEVNKEYYRILISDNGQGISKDEIIRVKEKFYKGKHSKSHSGIGLSVSDEIVKLHGGSLDIYSEKNIGTTVSLTIPIKEAME